MSEKKTAKEQILEQTPELHQEGDAAAKVWVEEAVKPRDLKKEGWITETRDYAVVTPIFGGGGVAGEPDTVFPVNGKGVRGQLRFWWRVMRGGLSEFDGSLSKMRQREEKVWGAAADDKKSKGDDKKGNDAPIEIVIESLRTLNHDDKKPMFEEETKEKEPRDRKRFFDKWAEKFKEFLDNAE